MNQPFVTSNTGKKYPLAYKATRTTLLEIYEKLIRKDYSKFMADFSRETVLYSNIVNNTEIKHAYDDEFIDLERIQGAPSYLLLLYLLSEQEKLELTEENIESIAQDLVKFFVRRSITDIPATRNLDRIFMDVVAEIKSLESDDIVTHVHEKLISESAPDEVFDAKLRGPIYVENDKAARFILCGIEAQHQTREIYTNLWSRNRSNTYVWTIEHIFPEGENIPPEWVDMIADGDKEKAEEYREEYVHTIGNLTLTGYNQNLSNMSFEKKKSRTDRDDKYIGYRNGLFLNEDVVSEDTWTVERIMNRTNKLVSVVKDIYAWD